jgi:hypothetical protein
MLPSSCHPNRNNLTIDYNQVDFSKVRDIFNGGAITELSLFLAKDRPCINIKCKFAHKYFKFRKRICYELFATDNVKILIQLTSIPVTPT